MKHMETARRLIQAMETKHITAAELSKKTDVSKASISQYVNGRNIPSNINAYKLGKALDVAPAWLMGFDAQMVLGAKRDVPKDYNYNNLNIEEVEEQTINQDALDLYYKYLAADKKTRKMIDMLLGDDNED